MTNFTHADKVMTKILNKWLRKFHRWIAVPTALAIPAAVVIKLFSDTKTLETWERLDKIPSILMLIMAISGAYLFLLPYIVKEQRKKRLAFPSAANNQSQKKYNENEIPA